MPTLARHTLDSVSYDYDMTYDSFGRLDVLTYPESTSSYRFAVDYDYDSYGHMTAARESGGATTYYQLDAADALGRELNVSLGNGLNEYRNYDLATGYLLSIAADPSAGSSIQDLSFTYDEAGNVESRANDLISKTENFTYDALDRLKTAQVVGHTAVTVNYSAAGRITSKSDVGSYSYGAGSAGPFAVTSAGGASYAYDANGRMTSRAGDPITWYSYDLPKRIDSGSQSSEFSYGVDRTRYKQIKRTGTTVDATILYVGQLLEIETAGASTTYRHYVMGRDRAVAVVERAGTTNTTEYLHRDHQDSVVKVTNSSGSVVESLAYDAWGLRRNASTWAALGSPFGGAQQTERGYTGHEHLDNVGLVHMNGRVQDPVIGRFISGDPIVQAPYHTQSHNRYSYVWNNPASYVDPSGFQGCRLEGYHTVTGCTPDYPYPERIPGYTDNLDDPDADLREFIEGDWEWVDEENAAIDSIVSRLGGPSDELPRLPGEPGYAVSSQRSWLERSDPLLCSCGYDFDLDNVLNSLPALGPVGGALGEAGAIMGSLAGAVRLQWAARGGTTTLYRAVSEAEALSVRSTGAFSAGPNSLGGKWFAETLGHAKEWGDLLNGKGASKILEVILPKSVADKLMRMGRLDGVGPARYGELGQLEQAIIRELP